VLCVPYVFFAMGSLYTLQGPWGKGVLTPQWRLQDSRRVFGDAGHWRGLCETCWCVGMLCIIMGVWQPADLSPPPFPGALAASQSTGGATSALLLASVQPRPYTLSL
jgi:hypothetical protein